MRAALYARVSEPKQKENFSIPTQLEAMREYYVKNNLDIGYVLGDYQDRGQPGLWLGLLFFVFRKLEVRND